MAHPPPLWTQASQARYKRLQQSHTQLPANSQLYGVIDSAASESIFEHLEHESAASEAMCIYDGQAAIKFAHVAPYLFKLHPHSALTAHWFNQGWDKHWGIVLASSMDIKTVKIHLKKFIQIDTPQGLAYWRFYDPRVLNQLLPLMTPAQAGAFMGVEQQTIYAVYTHQNQSAKQSVNQTAHLAPSFANTDLANNTVLQHTAYQTNALMKMTKIAYIKSIAIV